LIEGYIDPREELVLEGPFGDHTGFLLARRLLPEGTRHRRDLARRSHLAAHDRGPPTDGGLYLGHATERIFLPLLKLTIPEIVDLHMPPRGSFTTWLFVSIDKQYPGQAYKVMSGLWGQD